MKLSVHLLVLGAIAIVLVDLVVLVSIVAEISLVEQYGYGHVPGEKIHIFGQMSGYAAPIAVALGVLQVCFLAHFIFQSTKSLDVLNVEHRFSRLFSCVSIFIPIIYLYIPWASLGEARQTFEEIQNTQIKVQKSVRGIDPSTFMLGLVWMINSLAARAIGAFATDGPMGNAEEWMSTMTTARTGIFAAVGIDLVLSIVVIFYATGMLKLYRAAQAVTAIDVFGPSAQGTAGDALPPPIPQHSSP